MRSSRDKEPRKPRSVCRRTCFTRCKSRRSRSTNENTYPGSGSRFCGGPVPGALAEEHKEAVGFEAPLFAARVTTTTEYLLESSWRLETF